METTDTTLDDVERTSRDLNHGVWGVASILMTGSAVASWFAFQHLGEWPGVGVIEALGIDATLLVWLRIRSRLMNADVITASGRVLEFIAMLMTLYLNGGAAIFRGIDQNSTSAKVLLMVAHCFVPIIFSILLIAGGEARHRLALVRRKRDAAAQAARAADASRREAAELTQKRDLEERRLSQARGELVATEDYAKKARELREQADAMRQDALREIRQAEADLATATATRVATEQERDATRAAAEELRQARQERVKAGPPASREERCEWVRQYHRKHGKLPRPREVDEEFGDPRNGSAVVAKIRKELAQPSLKLVGSAK